MKEIESSSGLISLRNTVLVRFAVIFLLLGLMFFLSAWTFNYWEAWVYLFVLLPPMIFTVRYLYKHDPKLLERRMRVKEKLKTQNLIVAVSGVLFLGVFIVPGFDYRLNWSSVPLVFIVISDTLVLLGYLIMAFVFRVNSYTSRIIEVEKGQKVITTGPYARVRHPMYLGLLIFSIFSPLALGSYWALIPALHIIPLLVIRIAAEERELLKNLEGYKQYVIKTKYRLLPGIW